MTEPLGMHRVTNPLTWYPTAGSEPARTEVDMTETVYPKPAFGLDVLIPGIKAAWGARLIVTQDGTTDLLHNRQGVVGDDALIDETLEWLNGGVIKAFREAASAALKRRSMLTSKPSPTILYEDGKGVVLADTNGSYGYLYVTAYLFDALPDGHPTKGMERIIARIQDAAGTRASIKT